MLKNSRFMSEKLSIIFYNDIEPQERKYIKEEDHKTKQTIGQITECVISEMERMQYSPQTISTFRARAKQLSRYVQEKTGTDYFTEELGRRYLADTIGFPFAENRCLTSPESAHIRCVCRVGEYQLYGAVLRNYAKKAKILDGWELGDKEIITTYVESVQTADNMENSPGQVLPTSLKSILMLPKKQILLCPRKSHRIFYGTPKRCTCCKLG